MVFVLAFVETAILSKPCHILNNYFTLSRLTADEFTVEIATKA